MQIPKHTHQPLIIAIDGWSSCGKSTIAKALAARLGLRYIDTGAMYRAVTLYCLDHGISPLDVPAVTAAIDDIQITFDVSDGVNLCVLNGQYVEKEIRTMRVSEYVSDIAAISSVRRAMVRQQQEMGKTGNLVMDGRDIGTVVFPQAPFKLFVTADPEIRVQRRLIELRAQGIEVSYEEVLKNIEQRDLIDSTRADSPLKQAPDAVILDNSLMTPDEQIEVIMDMLRQRKLIPPRA